MPHFSSIMALNAVPEALIGGLRRWSGRSPYLPAHDATRSLFIHVPKAAGTSVSHALYGGPVGHVSAACYRAADPDRFDAYFKFAVVRHPATRFLSALRYLERGGGSAADRRFAARLKARFADRAELLAHLCRAVRRRAPWSLVDWGHFRQQTAFVTIGGRIAVDRVVRFETLAETFPEIAERVVGQAVPLPHRNASETGDGEKPLTGAEREMIAEIYADDFRAFGYAP